MLKIETNMQRQFDGTLLLQGAALALTLVASGIGTAVAQTESLVVEEIIVTGNKIERSLQDTQTSVSVLTGGQLEADSVTSMEDALLRVANANIDPAGNISIRGVDKNGSGGSTTNRMVLGVYVDGVAQSYQSQRFSSSTWDVKQIEVLRGPVGTLQGRNALAGAIVVNTNDPEFDFGGKLRASYGEDNTYQVAGALTGPLVDDVLAFRIAAEKEESDGDIYNTTTHDDKYGEYSTENVRAKLLFAPSSLPGLRALATFTHSKADPAPGARYIIGANYEDRRETIVTSPESSTSETNSGSLQVSYDFGNNLSLTSISAYASSDTLNLSPFNANDIANPQRITYGDFDDEIISQELRVAYSGDRLTALFGLYFADLTTEQGRGARINATALGGPSGDATVASAVSEKITNYAAFTDITYRLTDKIELQAGGRLDREEADFTRDSAGAFLLNAAGQPTTQLLRPIPARETSLAGTEFLPKAGIVYHFTDDVSLGYVFSKGYRPGGTGVDVMSAIYSDVLFYEFDAEKTDNHEVSLRTSWLDGRFIANANAYYVDWKNQQIVLNGRLSSLDDFVIVNGTSSSLYGAELELLGSFGGFQTFASVGYSKTEYDAIEGLAQRYVDLGFNAGVQLDGKEFRYSPNVKGAIGASYRWDFGLRAAIDGSYVGSSYINAANTAKIPDYTLVNVNVSYDTGFGEVFVYAKNVFDEDAVTLWNLPQSRWMRDSRNVGVGFQANF